MMSADSFLESPEGRREEISRTREIARRCHGYVSLTIRQIYEEFEGACPAAAATIREGVDADVPAVPLEDG